MTHKNEDLKSVFIVKKVEQTLSRILNWLNFEIMNLLGFTNVKDRVITEAFLF